jgi:hypothetical protein
VEAAGRRRQALLDLASGGAREQVLEMITRGERPFAPEAGWTRWHSDPSWPTPVLPPTAALP